MIHPNTSDPITEVAPDVYDLTLSDHLSLANSEIA